MNPANARALVPPRPNLGPEPWSDPLPFALFLWVAGALACLFLTWLLRRRLRHMGVGRTGQLVSNLGPRDTTPRGRLVALSHSMRDVLTNQFGTTWRAKTTEELSVEPRLAAVLGHVQLLELIRFFDQVDQLKFAPERSNHRDESLERELAAWKPRLADLEKKIQAKPAGRSQNKTVRSMPRGSSKKIGHAEAAPATTR